MKHINLGTLEVSRIGLGTMGIIYGSVVNVRYPAWGRLLELGINQAAASYRVTQSSNRASNPTFRPRGGCRTPTCRDGYEARCVRPRALLPEHRRAQIIEVVHQPGNLASALVLRTRGEDLPLPVK